MPFCRVASVTLRAFVARLTARNAFRMQAVRKDAAVAASLLGAVLAVGLVVGVLFDNGREATPVIDTLGGRGSTEIRL